MKTLNIAREHDGVNLDRSLDEKYLAVASGINTQIWNLSGDLLTDWVVDNNGWGVSSLSLGLDNQILAIASNRFGTVRLWNVGAVTQLNNHQAPALLKEWNTEQAKYISEMSFSLDNYLAVASNDGTVKLWDVKPTVESAGRLDPTLLAQLNGHQGAVSTIRFSPDGKLVATGGQMALFGSGILKGNN